MALEDHQTLAPTRPASAANARRQFEVNVFGAAAMPKAVLPTDASSTILQFGVEMDPPGGGFRIEVDAQTGRELSRTPDLT